jgi:hypothetical protein
MPIQSKVPDAAAQTEPDTQLALQHLLAAGVITQVEFQQLRARVTQ